MSATRDQDLDTCGCCGVELSKLEVFNRPGQPSLSYRIGTHSTFLHRMLARLHTQRVPPGASVGAPPLSGLSSRAADDPAIGLLDAAAVAADVLTFYQERIANEGYLRTATERRSVLELARSIGYELKPGVAASAYLAFTVEEAAGAPETVAVPRGTQVQSIPRQGQLPQTFETSSDLEARAAWNALRPRLTAPQQIAVGASKLYLKGTTTQLQSGDYILIVGEERQRRARSERWDIRVLRSVTPNAAGGYTLITWEEGLGHETPDTLPADNPRVYVFRQRAALFGHNAPDWRAMPVNVKQAYKSDVTENPATWGREWPDFEIRTLAPPRIDLDAVYPKILEDSWVALVKPSYVELYRAVSVAARSRTDFTLTAKTTLLELDNARHLTWFPLRDTLVLAQSEELQMAEQPIATPVFGDTIVLDSLVDGFEPDNPALVAKPVVVSGKPVRSAKVADLTRVVRVGTVEETREGDTLYLNPSDGSPRIALDVGEALEVAGPPTTMPDGGVRWRLKTSGGVEGYVTLAPDSEALEWQPAAEDEDTLKETLLIEDVSDDEERTTVVLSSALANVYDRATVRIYANVVAATHGETVRDEALGNGDGSQANQRFKLKKSPLTFVSAPTSSGAQNTLELRVNGVLWSEVPSLYGLDARSQSYVTRIQDDSAAVAIFGDGVSGARLPTGQENVRATYRTGIGLAGEVDAGSLTLMRARPLGIREVTNPTAASGAAEPETLDEARANAPKTVLTLDRIVSLRDFESFARAFAGVSKAQATAIWQGEANLVHVTIASVSGSPIEASSSLYVNLVNAIGAAYDPRHRFMVADYEPIYFHLDASVLVDSRYVKEEVIAYVKSTLLSAFAFERQQLGQPVTAASVVSIIQGVAGVVAVDLNRLYLEADPNGPNQTVPSPILPASRARLGDANQFRPAQLLLVREGGITINSMEQTP
jgi:hypothetical protein